MHTPLIFEHVPKAAGTTLMNICSRYYPPKRTLQVVPQRREEQPNSSPLNFVPPPPRIVTRNALGLSIPHKPSFLYQQVFGYLL
jgi:hypothetical protein